MAIKRLSSIGAVLFALIVYACAAPQPGARQEKASETLSQMTKDMTEARAQIDKTLNSLKALISAQPDDLNTAYNRFSKDVNEVRKDEARIQELANEMRDQGADWLAQWQTSQGEIQNPELKQVGEQRRTAVMSQLEAANRSMSSARREPAKFVSIVEDIRKAVGNDLTPRNVAEIAKSDAVRSADNTAKAATRALDVAVADLQKLNSALPPPETK